MKILENNAMPKQKIWQLPLHAFTLAKAYFFCKANRISELFKIRNAYYQNLPLTNVFKITKFTIFFIGYLSEWYVRIQNFR